MTDPLGRRLTNASSEDLHDGVRSMPSEGSMALRRMSLDVKSLMPERIGSEISERYNIQHTLGAGGYGKVYIATDKLFGDRRVAIKQVPCHDKKKKDAFQREVAIMKELDHPNICKLFETYDKGKLMYLVMDLCEGSEVFDRISEQGKISEDATADVIKQVSSALRYAHERGFAHRDLKPENICYYSADPNNNEIKVIDWGLAFFFGGLARMSSAVGSLVYAAPEVLDVRKGAVYNQQCDLWSLGVVAYVMLCGKPPFWGGHAEQLRRMKKETFPMSDATWQKTSPEAKDFVRRLLKASPAARMSIQEVVGHPWLQQQLRPSDPEVTKIVLDNMRRFSNQSHFLSMIVASVARQMDHRSLRDIHAVFVEMDTNGDGVLELNEVRAGFDKMFGPDSEQTKNVEEMFAQLDLDGSGSIDYTEFVASAISENFLQQENVLWNAFRSFDVQDDDGRITVDEIQKILQRTDVKKMWTPELCESAANEIIREFDANGDGSIDFHEFVDSLREHLKEKTFADELHSAREEGGPSSSLARTCNALEMTKPRPAAPGAGGLVRQMTRRLGEVACVTCSSPSEDTSRCSVM
eukprot:TRINITY_DN185_c0_g1_i1.p1 TRINITY_DN185_c0_g1~~TRINITY_DN185_c0_g1_i1.p1  ORF type:complete len:581 (-),score=115.79 TRINITY_DN185_c0_g1_i1:56-1798(-)